MLVVVPLVEPIGVVLVNRDYKPAVFKMSSTMAAACKGKLRFQEINQPIDYFVIAGERLTLDFGTCRVYETGYGLFQTEGQLGPDLSIDRTSVLDQLSTFRIKSTTYDSELAFGSELAKPNSARARSFPLR